MKYSFSKDSTNLIITLDTESGKYAPEVTSLNDPNITLENGSFWIYENGKFLRFLSFDQIITIDGVIPSNVDDAFTKLNTIINTLHLLASPKFKGTAVPTDTPTGTEDAFWIATQAGTYTNFGGVIVSANSRAEISRVSGVFTISQTPLDVTSKVNVSDVVDNLASSETAKPLSAAQGKVLNDKIILKAIPTGPLTAYTTVATASSYFGNKFGYVGKVSGINVFIVDKTVQLDIYKINTFTPSGFTLIKTVLSANLVNGLNVINFDTTIDLLKNEEIVLKGRYGYTTSFHTIVAFSATANSISNNNSIEIGYSLICASDKLDQYNSRITNLEAISTKLPLTCTLFGDSITENLGQTGAPYDNMVIRKFSEFSIITSVTNAGHQGHYLSGGGLYSLIQYATAITVFPKLIIIMAGTNDYGTSKALGTVNDDYTVSDATMCAGLKKILDHFTNGGSKVLFVTTPPRETETANNSLGLNLKKYVNAAKDVCYLPQYYKKVYVLDYFNLCGYRGVDEVSGNRYYTSDGLHLTYAGYESLTTAQANFVKIAMLNSINGVL